jgi:hypothetical protein
MILPQRRFARRDHALFVRDTRPVVQDTRSATIAGPGSRSGKTP